MLFVAGHANVQTDIKEAIFLGHNDDLVAAGSDDGNVFIYDAKTGQIVKILQADNDVANCVQVHNLTCWWSVVGAVGNRQTVLSIECAGTLLLVVCVLLVYKPVALQKSTRGSQTCFTPI